MEERFSRNVPAISEEEQLMLKDKKAVVIGCGGLGGYVIENLVRLGVGYLTVVDGDKFDISNLNRQILSTEDTLGMPKAVVAAMRAKKVCPFAEVEAITEFFTSENAQRILEGADVVIDALDNVASRLLLEEKCTQLGITIVHGAVEGWNAQVAVVPAGNGMLSRLYKNGVSGSKTCLGFTPAFCASIQSAQALKVLCGRKSVLEGKLLLASLNSMDFNIITI